MLQAFDGPVEETDRVRGDPFDTVGALRGPVRRGARFNRLRGSAQALDLTLTQAVVYGHRVAELDTGLTAFVTLRGEGVQHLKTGTLASGWQVIQGANPLP